MDRRVFVQSGLSVALAAGVGLPSLSQAQAGGFKPVKEIIPRSNPGKIDVIEFFWYGCPHCFSFEPMVQAWKKSIAPDVNFRQLHIGWPSKRVNFEGHQKLYFTLEVMGLLKSHHSKVFDAMHKDKKTLADDAQIFDFAESVGINRTDFANQFKSFAVATKCNQATALAAAYGVDGVPAMGVDGRYLTSASVAGSDQDALRVVDTLILRQRQNGGK